MRSWSWLWCSALFALAGGCVAGPTQLVVVVDSDLAIPAELDRVRVTVMADDTRMASEEQALGSASLLPLTVAAVPEDDSLGPIDVIAEGFVGSALVVSRRARVTLVRNETRMLRLDLVASCVGTDCGADRSCGENGCVDVVIDELPPWPGTAPRLLDAGGMDADVARDGGARDGGPRDGGGPIDANRPDGSLPPTDASTTACMDDSECDDGILCTTDACMGGLCVSTPDDSVCDDGNGCTDDRCTAAGCTMDPNVLPCDDGVFCNGFDRCAAGSCDMHGGDPCASPTVCDEAGTRCTGCRDDSDCPGPSNGAWGACDYADGCDESGTRMRTNRSYACMGGSCVPTDTPESEPCSRSTDGDTCGVGSCGSYGACNYSDGCDESATRSRTCTDLTCAGRLCRSNNRNETAACTRSTTRTSCGTTSCGSYGACDYSDGCDQSANRTRTCMDFACASGTCAATPRMESMACTRTTTGNSCGTESCGMYGACGYSSTCDEDGSRSRTCTQPTCAGGSCSGSTMRTDTATCTRSTEGTSCGAAQICRMGSCVSCTPILSGSFGTVGSTYFTAATGSGTTLTFADSTPSMGSVTASAGVTFSGSVTSTSCIWQVLTSGSSMTFTDFGGLSIGSITVSGASLSGSGNPACSPTPYGCFPPCLNRVVGSSGSLQLLYSDGSSGTITFGCP